MEPTPFNPYDALGLPTDETQYTEKDINRCRKQALLLVHPDKRKLPTNAWPSVDDVNNAAAYLIQALKNGVTPHQLYCDFPRSRCRSDPMNLAVSTGSEFWQCPRCWVILRNDDIPTHMGSHGAAWCNSCGEIPLTEDANHRFCQCPLPGCDFDSCGLTAHMRETHFLVVCEYCHMSPHEIGHFLCHHGAITACACGVQIYLEGFDRHVRKTHRFDECEHGCLHLIVREANNDLSHLYSHHGIQLCFFCDAVCFSIEGFQSHLKEHYFKPCPGCCFQCLDRLLTEGPCKNGHDKDHAQRHISANHPATLCGSCNRMIADGSTNDHLRLDHHFRTCPICDYAARNLEGHESKHHTACLHCQASFPSAKDGNKFAYYQHLREAHTLIVCPLCDEHVGLSDLSSHFADRHQKRVPCPECFESYSETTMTHHLRSSHGHETCKFCSELLPPTQVDSHRQTHSPQNCIICDQIIADGKMDAHVNQFHVRQSCPFCSSLFDGHEQFEAHLRNDHGVEDRAQEGRETSAASPRTSLGKRKRDHRIRQLVSDPSIVDYTLKSLQAVFTNKSKLIGQFSEFSQSSQHHESLGVTIRKLSQLALATNFQEHIAKISKWVALLLLANRLDAHCRLRADPATYDELLNFSRDKTLRNRIKYQAAEGRKLRKAIGKCFGKENFHLIAWAALLPSRTFIKWSQDETKVNDLQESLVRDDIHSKISGGAVWLLNVIVGGEAYVQDLEGILDGRIEADRSYWHSVIHEMAECVLIGSDHGEHGL